MSNKVNKNELMIVYKLDVLQKSSWAKKEFLKLIGYLGMMDKWANLDAHRKTFLFECFAGNFYVTFASLNNEDFLLRANMVTGIGAIFPQNENMKLAQALRAEYHMSNRKFNVTDRLVIEELVNDRFNSLHPELISDLRGEENFLIDLCGYEGSGHFDPNKNTSGWKGKRNFSADQITSMELAWLNKSPECPQFKLVIIADL